MILKPQDVLILLKLVAGGNETWAYNRLSVSLSMSSAEVHAGIKRALTARLATMGDGRVRPHRRNLEEFVIHGTKYVFVPDRGELTRGIPTGWAAAPLNLKFTLNDDMPPVWPFAEGDVRGQSFSPIYKSAPQAARNDSQLYELLVLVDALRGGNAREHEMAAFEFKSRLKRYDEIRQSQH